jgi:uncharacterized protein
MSLNVFGTPLVPCSYDPLTGYLRDGCCHTDDTDDGAHLVCTRVTQEFLVFSLQCGYDLMTPRPEYRFAGLKPGDRWCLCAKHWVQALEAGLAPPVVLECTHAKTLEFVDMDTLREHAYVSGRAGTADAQP